VKRVRLACSVSLLVGISGCITVAGNQLAPLSREPSAPDVLLVLEETVGNFSFHLDGGKMVTSNKMGRSINEEILEVWKKKGFIESSEYVKSSQFTGKADYNLTLSGSLYGKSSILVQILSGLTLMIIPHSIELLFDIQYTLEDVRTHEKYGASVEENYTQWSELFLIFAAPWSGKGERVAIDAMAIHLYDQLRRAGAFGGVAAEDFARNEQPMVGCEADARLAESSGRL